MKRSSRIIAGLALAGCLSANMKPSYLISPGADRHIRFLHDASDEAMDAYIFYRGKDDHELFMIDGLNFPTRPVIKYFADKSEVWIATAFHENYDKRTKNEILGVIKYMKFLVEPSWEYSAFQCEISISKGENSGILPSIKKLSLEGDREIARFVIAEMEKPKSSFLARGKCTGAKPWRGHEGMYTN